MRGTGSEQATACAICGHPLDEARRIRGRDRLHGLGGEAEVAVCTHCGAGNTLPLEPPDRLARYYPAGYGPYELPRGSVVQAVSAAIRAWQARRSLRTPPVGALRDSPPGRLVDVGCGRGDLGASFVARGWSVDGVEPSEGARAEAATRGLEMRGPTLAEAALEPASYDAATFIHSLEHVVDPVGDLRRIAASLRPGGVAAITVPNFGGWQRRRFQGRWYHLDLLRHRVHFGRAALTRALELAGLELVELRTTTSAVGLPASVQYALVGRCLFPEGLPLRIAAGLTALLYPLTYALDRAAGDGDLLHAVARRPN